MKNKIVKEFKKLLDYNQQVWEYIKAFDTCCPQGELAKEQATQEFVEVIDKTQKQIDKIKNMQVVKIYES